MWSVVLYMRIVNIPVFILVLSTLLVSVYKITLPGDFVFAADSACTDQTDGKSRSQLEQELAACEAEMAQWTQQLNQARSMSAGFKTDINVLTAKINAAKANINGKNIAINNLTKDITVKQSEIAKLDSRLERGREVLAEILRKTNVITSASLVETMLSNKDLSDFFADVDAYSSTERELSDLFNELRQTRSVADSERAILDKKREQEASARAALEASKKEVEVDQAEKQRLLAISQKNEKTYAQEVAERQAKAAQIKAVLFPLRDSAAIPFGTALQYAQEASAKTGVHAALILAILQQESNLGANVGSCVITDLGSGQTRSVNSGLVYSNGIHPTRDLPPLKTLLAELGRDPLQTRVSCPIAGVAGYGGAMGPAQFIPSTWNIIKGTVASFLGKSVPDPWNPADAIMASATLLRDLVGTTGDRYTDDRTAACRYYSGRTCYVGGKAGPGLSYGTQVMNRVAAIQRDIDFLRDN